MNLDSALQEVLAIIRSIHHNPMTIHQLNNIDITYASVSRVCIEVHQRILRASKTQEELEEGEEGEEGECSVVPPETNPLRLQLEELLRAGSSMRLDLEWPVVSE